MLNDPAHKRSEIVIVSKVGYVQGGNLRLVRERAEAGDGFEDVVRYMEGCWHCIHPDWIADQLARSLNRLQVSCIDVYLLHNPEYHLLHASRTRQDVPVEQRRDAFYAHLERAFEDLEGHVAAGRITAYGVSSNTFVVSPGRDDATSLSRMLAIAERVGGPNHHFAVAQAPMNLLEIGAAVIRNNGADLERTFLQQARQGGVTVLVNRPLNALRAGSLIRLADFDTRGSGVRPARLLNRAKKLEAEFAEGLGKALDLTNEDGTHEVFRYAERLAEHAASTDDAVAWDEYVQHSFGPEISQVVNQIDGALTGPMKAAWQIWLERYVNSLGELVEGLRARCARSSQRRSDKISRKLNPRIPKAVATGTLSSKAVAALLAVDGVDCVLAGMRQTGYVADLMTVLNQEPFDLSGKALLTVLRSVAP